MSQRLTFELTYYNHEIEKAIQALDIQALLNACLAAGGTDADLCSPFTRAGSGNLNPPNNFLANLGSIETDGIDLKIDWRGNEMSWGTLSAGLQATRINKFEAVDTLGIVSQRAVGIEVSDSAIPKLQANLQLGWDKGDWAVSWIVRYIDSVEGVLRQRSDPRGAGLQDTPASRRYLQHARLDHLQRRAGDVEQGVRHREVQALAGREQRVR